MKSSSIFIPFFFRGVRSVLLFSFDGHSIYYWIEEQIETIGPQRFSLSPVSPMAIYSR